MKEFFYTLTLKNVLLTLGLCTAAVYLQTLTFEFIALDDSKHIWSNPYITSFTFKNILFFWKEPYYGLFIPVVYNIWAILTWLTQTLGLSDPISGFPPTLFHLINAMAHFLNGFFAFCLLQFTITARNDDLASPTDRQTALALLASLFYILHPIQVEAVAWASGMKDTLSTFFGLLSAIFLLTLCAKPLQASLKKKKVKFPFPFEKLRKKSPTVLMSFSLLFFLLGVFCKPNIVVLPGVLFVWLVLFGQISFVQSIKWLSPLALTTLPIVYFTKLQQPSVRMEFQLEIFEYPFVAIKSLGFYLEKIIFPIGLGPDYNLSPPLFLKVSYWQYAFGGAFFAIVGWLTVKKEKFLLVGAASFCLGLLPVLGLIPFEYQNMSTVADRYSYFLPMLGVTFFAYWFFETLDAKNELVIPVALLCVMGGASLIQTSHWKNNLTLFTRVLKTTPKSYLAHNNLGLTAIRDSQFDIAEKHLMEALDIKPNYLAAQSNLGVVYFKRKDYSKVIQHYEKYLKGKEKVSAGSSATYADMYYNFGAALLNSGRLQESLKALNKAAEVNINHFPAQFHRGRVYAHINDLENAKTAFLHANRIKPNNPQVIDELKKLHQKGIKF